ncbi:unnamed protein product, partial [Rotaria sordida]
MKLQRREPISLIIKRIGTVSIVMSTVEAATANTTTAMSTMEAATTAITPQPLCSLNSFTNGDFENGTSFGWTIGGGSRDGINSLLINPSDYLPGGSRYVSNIASSHSSIVTNGSDPTVGKLMPNIVYS